MLCIQICAFLHCNMYTYTCWLSTCLCDDARSHGARFIGHLERKITSFFFFSFRCSWTCTVLLSSFVIFFSVFCTRRTNDERIFFVVQCLANDCGKWTVANRQPHRCVHLYTQYAIILLPFFFLLNFRESEYEETNLRHIQVIAADYFSY